MNKKEAIEQLRKDAIFLFQGMNRDNFHEIMIPSSIVNSDKKLTIIVIEE